LPSVSPARPGRASVFSEGSSEADLAVREFVLPVDTPQRPGAGEEPGDIRTFKLKALMRQKFEENEKLSIDAFTAAVKTRKALANTFYHVLLLGSAGQIKLEQKKSYEDIIITKTISF
jgi:hypothetical protein